jgi:hypothetical protein
MLRELTNRRPVSSSLLSLPTPSRNRIQPTTHQHTLLLHRTQTGRAGTKMAVLIITTIWPMKKTRCLPSDWALMKSRNVRPIRNSAGQFLMQLAVGLIPWQRSRAHHASVRRTSPATSWKRAAKVAVRVGIYSSVGSTRSSLTAEEVGNKYVRCQRHREMRRIEQKRRRDAEKV